MLFYIYCSEQLIHCISENKNNLRTIYLRLKSPKKLRTAQPQPKVTGSYIKKSVYASCVYLFSTGSKIHKTTEVRIGTNVIFALSSYWHLEHHFPLTVQLTQRHIVTLQICPLNGTENRFSAASMTKTYG